MSYVFTYRMQNFARVSEWLLYATHEVPGKPLQWMERYKRKGSIFVT
jgi:hypothetical protein